MTVRVEIFSQGDEVLSGQVVDSNAAWLSEQCVQMGFNVTRHTAVGDDLAEMQVLLNEIAARTDCCLCTGGLGPTVDDLTAQAVAQAFDLPLQQDEVALKQIKAYFTGRNRAMAEVNRKQAMLPLSAQRLDNWCGTAPGFSMQYQTCRFYFMPGVPSEMRQMFVQGIQPQLRQLYSVQPAQLVSLKTVGIGESDIQQKLKTLCLPDEVQLGFRACPEDVQTKLLFPANYNRSKKIELVAQVEQLLGDYVYVVDEGSSTNNGLISVIDQLMQQQKLSLTVLETASHGLLAAKCVAKPWFKSSLCYPTEAMVDQKLGLTVSVEGYQDKLDIIAQALKTKEQTDLVLLQLYSGGEQAFLDDTRSITLYTGLLSAEKFSFTTRTTAGSHARKQSQAAILALDYLRRFLQQKN